MRFSVILPCRDEEDGLPRCIDEIRSVMRGMNVGGGDYEIIVSDSSTDRSPEIAGEMGARVVKHDRGYGDALIAGLDAAAGDYLFFADCDCSYDFRELPEFISALDDGFDFVIGSRFKGMIEEGAMPPLHRYVGNPLLSFLFNVKYGTDYSDVHSGFRALTREAYERMSLKCRGMEYAIEMLAEVERLGLKVGEVPITYSKRMGKSKLHTLSDGFRHLRYIVRGY